MRSSRRTFAAPLLLGSTFVYAMPSPSDSRLWKRILVERAPQLDGDITFASGFTTQFPAPSQNNNQNSGNGAAVTADSAPTSTPASPAAGQANPSPTAHDTLTDASTYVNNGVTYSSGFATHTDGSASVLANHSDTPVVTLSSSTSSAQHSSLASAPAQSSGTNHGVLIGVVVGGLVVGCVVLTLGLWLCYRRRGPTSGASTPKYDTAVTGDEKPSFAFLRVGGGGRGARAQKWKRGHLRVKSSQSFASPMIANDPKLMEEVARTRTRTLSVKNPPSLPPHVTGPGASGAGAATVGVSGAVTGRDRWSTFSSSDGGSLQTPIGTTRMDGIIMETVVESDAHSNPHSPVFGGIPAHRQSRTQPQTQHHQSSIDYLDLKRTPSDDRSPFDSQTQLPPLALGGLGLNGSRMSRLSLYRDETDLSSPSTSNSSGSLTYGSNGRPRRTSDRYTFTQPLLTTNTVTPNVSYPTISTQHQASNQPFFSGANANALVATRPRFNPTHTNKSGVSVGANSGNSADTIRITNPFLGGEDDDLSSYGHGIIEADHLDQLDLMGKGDEDALSINTLDSDALAYPSSTGCLPNKPSPSPNHFAHPTYGVNPALIEADAAAKVTGMGGGGGAGTRMSVGGVPRASTSSTQTPSSYTYTTHPRSSMISDSSSDYPYPLGYAIDHEGNVANPFLRISEILEEVDGRMRWPSPPLLPRSESPNY